MVTAEYCCSQAEFTYYVDDLLFALCFEVGHGDVADVGGHSIEFAFVG